jgi:alkylation response protein AidB-like acyl-CoA dehydrogenase
MHCVTRYHPSPEQLEVAAQVTASLDKLLPLSRLHVSHEERKETWRLLAELGVFGITLGEDAGGSALGLAEEALIVMALGRRLVAPGVIASIGAVSAYEHEAALADIPHNHVAAAYREGERLVKVEEGGAKFVLLRQETYSVLLRSDAASSRLDDRLWLADLRRLHTRGRPIAVFSNERQLRLRLLDAAVLVGVAEAALAMAVDYAGVREQFGRPIGSFQAIKHHCANMALAARQARDQTTFAAIAMDSSRSDAALQVECAFVIAGTAALEAAGLNIQIHGGLGFSDEADPHLLLKRARVYINIGGGLEAASTRIGAIEPML